MQKGISTVIAALLMLIITIALAGFAYTYISGILTARTSVVLDIVEQSCIGEFIQVTIRNDGTAQSGTVTVTATDPDGGATGSCTTATINPGTQQSCAGSGLNRPPTSEAGTYRIRVSASGASPVTGIAFCPTDGTGA